LGQSIYLREILGKEEGPPPPVDLALEKKNGDFVRSLIEAGKITACHDCSDGGLLVALAEMTYKTGIGANITANGNTGFWFGEDQARYIVTGTGIADLAKKAGVEIISLGNTGGNKLEAAGFSIATDKLRATYEGWLPKFMG
jgi:phosphoribosylformylglycinamidine synthase subunit PurL